MSKIKYIVFIAIIIFAAIQTSRISNLNKDIEIHEKNEESLLLEKERYLTKDSLRVLSISELSISLDAYKQYKREDYELIQTLKAKNNKLEKILAIETESKIELEVATRDSFIYIESLPVDTLICWDYKDEWFTVSGCFKDGKVNQNIEVRDELIYVEYVVPKRFLFFKWGVKSRKQEIISKRLKSEIKNAEFITIK